MEAPGGVHGSFFAGYVQLASQNLCRILAYVVANYRPHLCLLLGKTRMDWEPFIKYYHAVTTFLPWIFSAQESLLTVIFLRLKSQKCVNQFW